MTLKIPSLMECDTQLRTRLQTSVDQRSGEQLRNLLALVDSAGIHQVDMIMSIGTVNLRIPLAVAAVIHEDQALLQAVAERGVQPQPEDAANLAKAFMEATLGLRVQQRELARDAGNEALASNLSRQQSYIEQHMARALKPLVEADVLTWDMPIDFDRTVAWKRVSRQGSLEQVLEWACPAGMAALRNALLEDATNPTVASAPRANRL